MILFLKEIELQIRNGGKFGVFESEAVKQLRSEAVKQLF